MSLKLQKYDNNFYFVELENKISPWNLLKFCCDAPYLKQYLIESYEGGNTLIPRETWKEEGILYKELENNILIFPYESIGFVLNDSISNLTLYVLDNFDQNNNYKENFELLIKIINTDILQVIIKKNFLYSLCGIYLFSIMNLGFDIILLKNLEKTIKSIRGDDFIELSYIESSLLITIKGINFIIKIQYNENEYDYYQFQCNKSCKKKLLKVEESKNFGILKKKILEKNNIFKIIYYSIISIFWLTIFLIFRKKFLLIIILLVLYFIIKKIIKKNIYKFYNKFNIE